MATYSYITDKSNGNRKIQVESARRDGDGKNIANNYSKQNGYYENERVGLADNLASNRQIDNPETACPPIVMGVTGGSAEIKSGIETFEQLEGNSFAFNQLVKELNSTNWYTNNASVSYSNGVATMTATAQYGGIQSQLNGLISGHKYLIACFLKSTTATDSLRLLINDGTSNYASSSISSTSKQYLCSIANVSHTTTTGFAKIQDNRSSGWDTVEISNVQVIDLTLIYGAGNEPTTVEEFKFRFPNDYYAYNSGTILSAKTNALISRGRQQWDEEWENGYINVRGENVSDNSRIRSKNYIKVIPNTNYYFYIGSSSSWARRAEYDINGNCVAYETQTQNGTFKTTSQTASIRFSVEKSTYNHDITISVYFEDGEGYNEYYPYSQYNVELPNIELRAIGDLKDIAYASGGGKRRLGYVDLGTLTWTRHSDNRFVAILTDAKLTTTSVVANLLCAKYSTNSADNVYAKAQDKILGAGNNGLNRQQLWVYDSAYNDATTFKTSLSGVYLLYELATEEELTENTGWNSNISVDNYGTLEFTTSTQQVPQVPQPYFIKYTVNLGEWVDSAYVRTNGDANDIALLEDVQELQDKLEDGDIVVAKSKLSDNLDTNVVQNDVDAYTFRTSGGSLEIGETCKVKEIVGGTVAFNQWIVNGNFSSVSNWLANSNVSYTVSNNVATIINTSGTYNGIYQEKNVIQGHKYLILGSLKLDESSNNQVALITTLSSSSIYKYVSGTSWNDLGIVASASETGLKAVKIQLVDWVNKNVYAKNIMFIDLTQMFGSTIADYIYSLEQANAGSGVAWFKRYFPNTYYAYNSGTLVNVQTSGKKYVGFNQWDEQWESGFISTTTGENIISATRIRSKNFINVTPITTYYFKNGSNTSIYIYYYDASENFIDFTTGSNTTKTTPANCHLIKIALYDDYGTTYNNDICINFHYDGERDGEYEPYESNEYPLSPIELRGIAKKDDQGNLYFDGDTYEPDGKVTRRYGIVDLGTLTYSYSDSGYFVTAGLNNTIMKIENSNSYIFSGVCPKYLPTNSNVALNSDKVMWTAYWYSTNGGLCIRDTNYNDATTFKTAMNGVYLVYELATPTEDTTYTYLETQQVNNWGTEQYLPPSEDTRPCVVPVGHNTDYLLDIRSKVEIMPDSPTNDGVYVVETSSGVNTYIPLSTWLNSNGYVHEISANAIKENIGGTLRQCLCVKESLDFENTDFVDLGNLTFTKFTVAEGTLFRANKPANSYSFTSPSQKAPIICSGYATETSNDRKNMTVSDNADGKWDFINNDYSDATTFKNAMKGVLLAYEKASS